MGSGLDYMLEWCDSRIGILWKEEIDGFWLRA